MGSKHLADVTCASSLWQFPALEEALVSSSCTAALAAAAALASGRRLVEADALGDRPRRRSGGGRGGRIGRSGWLFSSVVIFQLSVDVSLVMNTLP